jgi:general secretion pathway protein K
MRRGQQGMAVVAALVIVALVAAVAASVVMRQAATLRAVEAEQIRARATWLIRDAVGQAILTLQADAQRLPQTRLDGDWHRPLQLGDARTIGMPMATLRIEDAQARFNLRNLVRDGAVDDDERATFERLCAQLQLPAARVESIVASMIATVPHAPRGQSPGTQARPLPRDLDDLHGIDPATLARLRPYVTVLPENTWTNANTTTPEVLAASVPGLGVERADALLRDRDRGQWFINTGDIANRLRHGDATGAPLHIGIVSHWFQVEGVVAIDGQRIPFRASIRRAIQAKQAPELMWLQVGA